MALSIPTATQSIYDHFESELPPTVDYEVADKLGGLHNIDGLTEAERKGAWAEATAFQFMPARESPWGIYFSPFAVLSKPDGTPSYVPDLAEVDEEIIAHWESRSENTKHPVLRARYADVVWDIKKKATNKPPGVVYAHRAIDAYLDGISAGLYKQPLIHAIQAGRRSLELAVSIGDNGRVQRSREVMLGIFDLALPMDHLGAWIAAFDALIETKKAGLTEPEIEHLIQGLENMLAECSRPGERFDPFGAEAAARRLASYYERRVKKEEARRVIRAYGGAFEHIAKEANSSLAMGWLQPVHEEFKNRGMNEDAERVLANIMERGKTVASELKQMRVPVELKESEIEQIVANLTQGPPRDSLLRIASELIPKIDNIKRLLEQLLTSAPLLSRTGVTRIVDGRFAAQAGSIEDDTEGRLIMQLAQHIDFYSYVLGRALDHLRTIDKITPDMILSVLYESPVFRDDRRSLIEEGIVAYLAGDYTKAVHVLLPQIEEALRQLLGLMRVPTLKAGRNGTMQVKNLNDMLREPAIRQALGENIRLYLQTLLADERGQNFRNAVCHGLAAPPLFNQRLADQVLHALLTVSLIREKKTDPPANATTQEG